MTPEVDSTRPRFPPLLEGHRWQEFCARRRLTPREAEVLGLVCRGLRNAGICKCLRVRPDTLRSHIRAMLRKLGCRNRLEVVLMIAHVRIAGLEKGRSGM